MKLYTIGFTQKTAEAFFETLKSAGVKRIVDVRLNNTSQLAGFAKQEDLVYFLKTIGGIGYVHLPQLAPDKELLDRFKKKKGDWREYEKGFKTLLAARKIDGGVLARTLKDGDCLLCSEHVPEHCHRRIIAETYKSHDNRVRIIHL